MKSNAQRINLCRKNSVRALTRVEVLAIVVIVTLFLLSVLLPWFNDARSRARSICCNCNLKGIGLSFKMWAGDHNDKYPMQVSATGTNGGAMEFVYRGILFPVFQVMSNELNTPKVVNCPADSQRFPATNFTTAFSNTNISYFVGLDADETQAAMFLAGDRNITNGAPARKGILELTTNEIAGWTGEIHRRNGNILLTDGSVQQATGSRLNYLLQNSGVATNRLLMP